MAAPAIAAAAMLAGQFLTNMMSQQAAEKEAQKKQEMEAIQDYTQSQMVPMQNMMNAYRSALVGG